MTPDSVTRISDDRAARPGFLRAIAIFSTAVYLFSALVFIASGQWKGSPENVGLATLATILWALIAIPSLVAAYVRQRRIAIFGETFVVTDPFPLIIGHPFTATSSSVIGHRS